MTEKSNEQLVKELEEARAEIKQLKEDNTTLQEELDDAEGRLENEYDPKQLTSMYQEMCTSLKAELENAESRLDSEKE